MSESHRRNREEGGGIAQMVCRASFQVNLPHGLHIRPAARIAELAAEFPGNIRLVYGHRCADAQSILDILSLGVPQGAEVLVESDRQAADEIIERIRQIAAGTPSDGS